MWALPSSVHLAFTLRHSHENCSQALPIFIGSSPDIIHMTGPRPYPFFSALLNPCIILDANRRAKMGKAWERG